MASVSKTELHAPIGKDGEGLYTASTKGCFDVINAATPAVLKQVEKQTLTAGAYVQLSTPSDHNSRPLCFQVRTKSLTSGPPMEGPRLVS